MSEYYKEKVVLILGTIVSTALSSTAAILSDGEARWILVTFTISTLTAVLLALGFRAEATMRQVVSRTALSIIGGVLGTHFVIHRFGFVIGDKDTIGLAMLSAGVCGFSYMVGWSILEIVDRKRKDIAKKFTDKL